MSAIFRVPGSLFGALGNPKVEDFVEGLPGAGLSALYLFDNGPAGQAFSGPAEDRSGNGRHAQLWTGSVAHKTAGGVSNVAAPSDPANRGFGILTPVSITRKFTIFGVMRNLLAADPASTSQIFTMPWLSSGDAISPANPSTSGSIGIAGDDDGRFHINMENGVAGARDYAEVGIFGQSPNGAGGQNPWFSSGSARPFVTLDTSTPKNSWVAWALSFDADAGILILRAFNSVIYRDGIQTPARLWADGQVSRGGKHSFGMLPYSAGSHLVKGEVAQAGIYSGLAKSGDELATLLAAVKSQLAPRLGTIL